MKGAAETTGQIEANLESISHILEESQLGHENPLDLSTLEDLWSPQMKGAAVTEGQIEAFLESISPILEESELGLENPLLHQTPQKLKNLKKNRRARFLLIFLP